MTIQALVDELNKIEAREHARKGFTHPHDVWRVKKTGKKYTYLDVGGSGAFLIDGQGEIYNIKAYGVADMNKKKKADLGNIATVDPEVLHSKRWNYLR